MRTLCALLVYGTPSKAQTLLNIGGCTLANSWSVKMQLTPEMLNILKDLQCDLVQLAKDVPELLHHPGCVTCSIC